MPAKIPKPTIFSMPKPHKQGSFSEKTGKKQALEASPESKNIAKNHSNQEADTIKTLNETQNIVSGVQNRSNDVQSHLKKYLLAVKETGCSNSTIRNYRSDINQFLSFLESNDLEELKSKPKLIAFAQYQRDKGLKENSIKRKLVSVTQFKLWLKEQGLLASEIPLSPELEKIAANELKTIEPQKFSQEEKKNAQIKIESLEKKNNEEDAKKEDKKERKGVVLAFNLLALLIFLGGLAFFAYQQFGQAVISSMAYPDTPTRTSRILSYQGRLTDTTQNPINTSTDMSYKLYDADSGGTQLWSSNTCAVDPDQDGIFNVNLGAGNGDGNDDESCGDEIDDSVFTENANVWLEVTVGAETLSPRQPIRTVAYAINAETLQGLPPAEIASNSTIMMMNSDGEVVLGTTTPLLKSDSSSSSLTIESNQLVLRTATGSNGDVIISPDGDGDVIISSDLDLSGFLTAPGATFSANYAGGTSLVLQGGPSGTANIQEWQDSTGGLLSSIDANGTADFSGLTINSTYTFPTTDGSADQVLITDGSGNLTWGEGGGSGGNTYWQLNSGALSPGSISNDILIGATATASALVKLPGISGGDVVFNSGGNVGIGDIAPSYDLDVAGDIGVQDSIIMQNSSGIIKSDADNKFVGIAGGSTFHYNYGAYITASGNSRTSNEGDIWLVTGNASKSDMNFTIGNPSAGNFIFSNGDITLANDGNGDLNGGGDLFLGAGNDLELYHDGANSYIMNNTGDLYIGDAGTDNVILSNNGGYVGIGTDTPNNLLEVAGLINFDDAAYNTLLGRNAGHNVISGAEGNTYIGNSAGLSAASGGTADADYNTAVGYEALKVNSTGSRNTAVGTYSLSSNTTGHRNASFGFSSLESNTEGYQNSGFGSYTLQDNTTGNYNNAIGSNALQHNTEGDNNNAMGQGALSANTTGSLNTAVGSSALSSNLTGSQNVGIGYSSLSEATGSANTAIGYNAGRSITTGENNLFLGYEAGYNASQSATVSNSIAIGNGAYTTADNQVVLGNDDILETILNGDIDLDAGAYINWDDVIGESGYGIRDNGGTLQYKNSGGDWADIGSGGGSSLWTDGGDDTYLTSLTDNVGIGTDTPDAKLEVRLNSANEDLRIRFGKTFDNDPYNLALDASMNDRGFAFTSEEGTYQQAMLFSDVDGEDDVFFGISTSSDSGSTWNPAFVITQDGNIGIGTATPSAKLTIGGTTSTISNESGDINIDSASNIINFNSDSLSNFTQASGSSGTTAQPTYSFNSDNNSGMYSPQADNLGFSVGGTEALRILANGNVGIGVDDPDEKLVVDGAITAEKLYDLTNKNYFIDPAAVSSALRIAGDADIGGDIYLRGGELFFTPLNFSTSTTEGTVYYDDDVDHLYMYDGDSTWHRIALDMTKYSDYDTLENQEYIEISHNQNSNDLSFTAWIKDKITGLWRKIDPTASNIDHDLSDEFNPDFADKTKIKEVSLGYQQDDLGDGSDGAVTITANTDVNTTPIAADRIAPACPDFINFNVTALTSTTATLTGGNLSCIEAGDEVLLINLQGTPTSYGNVGNYETLRLAANPSGSVVTFTTAKQNYYGDNPTDDSNLGTTTGTQRVMLQRVPNYTNVTVNSGVSLYPSNWNQDRNGVVFFRATGTVSINGTIHSNGDGYGSGNANGSAYGGMGGGSFCQPEGTTSAQGGGGNASYVNSTSYYQNAACGGGAGQSSNNGTAYGSRVGTTSLGGAGGGGGAAQDTSSGYDGKGGGGAGGGYGSAGVGGMGNAGGSGRAASGGTNSSGYGGTDGDATHCEGGGGGGGGTYGVADLSKLMFGAAGGAGGSGEYDNTAWQTGGTGGNGGGIVYIAADTVTVNGALRSHGNNGTGGNVTQDGGAGSGGGGAGGSIKVVGNTVNLGSGITTTSGGAGGTAGAFDGGNGGVGRIAVYSTNPVSGTSSPAYDANTFQHTSYALYVSNEIETPGTTAYNTLSWTENLGTGGEVEFQTRSGATPDSTDGTWSDWVTSWSPNTLDTANDYSSWSASNATLYRGDVVRNVNYFEDEDESNSANMIKMISSAADGYAEKTISAVDISAKNYITFWVRSSIAGEVIKFGMGESTASEQEETFYIDKANTWQKVYWDIRAITNTSIDAVTKIRVTSTTSGNTVYFDNIKAEIFQSTSGSAVYAPANDFIQYRFVLSTTDQSSSPTVSEVKINITDTSGTHTIDADSVEEKYPTNQESSGELIDPESLDYLQFSLGDGSDGAVTITANTDVNTTPIAADRIAPACPDFINFNVTALTSTTATLTGGNLSCIEAGDEVLLINLQGTPTSYGNVGNYETLRLAANPSGSVVTFTTAKQNYYGDNPTDDSNLGTTTGTQRVMLQRVPNYTNVTVNSGVSLYPSNWNQDRNGVVFFRATGTVSINGTIHSNGDGYGSGNANGSAYGGMGGGSFCQPEGTTSAQGGGGNASYVNSTSYYQNAACGGGAGQSSNNGTAYGSRVGTTSLGGAGGGGGAAQDTSSGYDGKGGGGAGGGYGSAGVGGMGNAGGSGRAASGGTNSSGYGGTDGDATHCEGGGGGGGGTYGVADLSKLMFGAAGGAGGSGEYDNTAWQTGGTGGNGGGIVYIAADTVTVNGALRSHGNNGTGGNVTQDGGAGSGGGGAGGSIKVVGNTVNLGSGITTTSGGAGGTAGAFDGGNGGVGRIAVYSTNPVSGTSSPSYTNDTSFDDHKMYKIYTSNELSTPGAVSFSTIEWSENLNTHGEIQVMSRSGATPDSTDGTWSNWGNRSSYFSLDNASSTSGWSSSNATLNSGDITRNVDYFEDEDESTSTNLLKLVSSAVNGYTEKTISAVDLSAVTYVSMWVRSATAGETVTLGIGESAATEQTRTFYIDEANVWQKVFWDVRGIANTSIDAVTKLRITTSVSSNTVYFDNIWAGSYRSSSSGATIDATGNDYLQYRFILSTKDKFYSPTLGEVRINYTDTSGSQILNDRLANQNDPDEFDLNNRLLLTEIEENDEQLINTASAFNQIYQSPYLDSGDGTDGAITITTNTDINTTPIATDRIAPACPDFVNFNVTNLTETTATIATNQQISCLKTGDEVLLINLQGTPTSYSNVGKYETLRIESIAGNTISFSSSKTNYYGDNPTDDSNLGTTTGTQRVMLQRVPNYTDVTVLQGVNMYPSGWNQDRNGVVFFRATGTVAINGTIHANGYGYGGGNPVTYQGGMGGGAFCQPEGTTSVQGGGGNAAARNSSSYYADAACGGGAGATSYNGTSTGSRIGTSNLGGAGGGGGAAEDTSSGYDGKGGGGGGGGYGGYGYGGWGNAGGNSQVANGGTNFSGNGGTDGDATHCEGGGGGGGGTYGVADLSKLMFGAGGGAGGAGEYDNTAWQNGGNGGNGGGIVYISANNITVNGALRADGNNGTGGNVTQDGGAGSGGGGAGGSVKVVGNTVSLGTGITTAYAGAGATAGAFDGGNGGSGRIAVYSANPTSGSSSPSYSEASIPSYHYGIYVSDEINTPNAVTYEKIKWNADLKQYGQVVMQTRSGATSNSTDESWSDWENVDDYAVTTIDDAEDPTLWIAGSDDGVENLNVWNGIETRDIDFFEDENEDTAGDTIRVVSGGSDDYVQRRIGTTDLSDYDTVSIWVHSTISGNNVKLGFGETDATEHEQVFHINEANEWQKIYWDISDIPNHEKNEVRHWRISFPGSSYTLHFDDIVAEKHLADPDAAIINSPPNEYLQYRIISSTTQNGYFPEIYSVNVDWNNGYKVEQVNSNTIRLYNYTGDEQDMRLDVIVFGADLAEWYTVDDNDIGPGDLVSITGDIDDYGVPILRKSNKANDPFLIGAISTQAGTELGISGDDRRLLGLDGRIPVKMDPNSAAITKGDHLTSSDEPGLARKAKAGELSIGRAFQDWDPESGEDSTLIIINDVMATPSFGQDLVNGITEIADLINLKIQENWQIIDESTGESIEAAAALAEAIIGKLKVGQMEVQEITSPEGEDLAIEGSNVTIELGDSSEASGSTPLGKLMIQNAEGETVASFDSEGNAYISGELDVEGISKLGQLVAEEATVSALLAENIETTNFETENASISGDLVAENIIGKNGAFTNLKAASIEVDSIEAGMISGLEERLSSKIAETLEEPSLLAALFKDEIEQNEAYLEELNAEIDENLDFEEELSLEEIEALENEDGDLSLIADTAFIDNYFEVNGSSYIKDSLKVGNNLIFESGLTMASNYLAYQPELDILTDEDGNEIENNDFTFSIQPTGRGRLSLMAGLMELDHSGQVTISGDLKVAGAVEVADDLKIEGSLLSNLIRSENPGENIRVQLAQKTELSEEEQNASLFDEDSLVQSSDFEFIDESETPIATFSATGDLSLEGSLKISQDIAIATTSGELVSKKSAGQAFLAAGQTEVTIKTDKLTANSMIYITPLNSTNNQVLYVKGKLLDSPFTPENEAQFTVGFDTALGQNVNFNWWIVN